MTGRRLRTIFAALLALGIAAWAASGGTLGAFSSQTSNNSTFSAAADFVAPTVNPEDLVVAATVSGTPMRLPGWVHQGGTYKIYANVSDTGNPSSGVSSVTANVTSIGAVGDTAVALTFDNTGVTVNGVTYHYISAEKTAANPLTASVQNKTFSVTATDGAGNSSGAVTSSNAIGVDNTNPPNTTNIVNPGANIRGNTTITGGNTVTDTGGSGLSGEEFQISPNTANTWTRICFALGTGNALSCVFNTTTKTDGAYDFRGQNYDNAGNAATASGAQSNKRIDNTPPVVNTFTVPAGTLSGTSVALSANITDAGAGVNAVTFEVRTAGSGSYSTACLGSGGGPSYTCNFDTTTLSDGSYDFRVTANDKALDDSSVRNTVSSAAQTRTIDNPPSASDVQASNGGGTANTPDAGDTIVYTFDQPMDAKFFDPADTNWSGSTKTGLSVRLVTNGAGGDFVQIFDGASQINLGTHLLKGDFVQGGTNNSSYIGFNSSTMSYSGSTLTVTLGGTATAGGAAGATLNGGVGAKAMTWGASASAKDATGNAAQTTVITESGTNDADF